MRLGLNNDFAEYYIETPPKYNNVQLAQRIFELAEKFYLYAINNKTKVIFNKGHIYKNECGTVACHGGFGNIILGKTYKEYYTNGADKIAQYLGFENRHEMTEYFSNHPEYWGNDCADEMFYVTGHWAFGFESKDDEITLFVIIAHYIQVAKNLLEIKND